MHVPSLERSRQDVINLKPGDFVAVIADKVYVDEFWIGCICLMSSDGLKIQSD